MIRIAQQVSRAIRILRGNRDESARASHLVVNKERFAYNELLQVNQAERERFFQSTFFERKTMSTKTAFKRLALVAAAALAIGGVSAVSANAAGALVSDSFTAGSAATASTSTTANTASTVALTYSAIDTGSGNAASLSGTVVSSPITSARSTVSFALTAGATQVNLAGTAAAPASVATGRVTEYVTASFTPDVSGTYVIKLASAGAINNAYVTWTITVAALAPITAASSTLVSSPSTLVASQTQTGTTIGHVTITANNSTANAAAAVLSATVSGPGLVSFSNFAGAGRSVSQAANNSGTLQVYADGNAGVGTITISSGSTVLGTVTATFYGTPVKYTVAVINPVVPVSATTADSISVSAVDSNGFAVPSAGFGTLTLTSDATSSVTSVLSGQDTASTGCSITVVCYDINSGATAGTANITIADTTNSVNAAPVAVRASAATPAAVAAGTDAVTVTFSTDAASYPAGGVGTLTITIADAAGPVPAGAYAVLSAAATSSLALVTPTTLPGGTITVGSAGTKTLSFNAPLSDGTVTVTGTAATSPVAVTVVPASFDVTSGASDAANAATDAANEATDAANAATDAANAAADSADAATQAAQDAGDKADAALAAVTALSQQVTTLLAKVAAVSAALAKISAAIAKLPKK